MPKGIKPKNVTLQASPKHGATGSSGDPSAAHAKFWPFPEFEKQKLEWKRRAAVITVEFKVGQGKKTSEEIEAADTNFMVETTTQLQGLTDMSILDCSTDDDFVKAAAQMSSLIVIRQLLCVCCSSFIFAF